MGDRIPSSSAEEGPLHPQPRRTPRYTQEARRMSETLTILLPWPYRSLSPNARLHWRRVAEVKKLAKRDAFYATKAERNQKIDAMAVSARVTFFPPDRRARDIDNMIASMKASFDGISDAIGI